MARTNVAGLLTRGALNGLPPADQLDLFEHSAPDDGGITGLWQGVLLRLVEDARIVMDYRARKRRLARAWLVRASPDRSFVLAAAGIDEQAFTTRGLPRLLREWAALDEQRAATGGKGRPPRAAALQGFQALAA